LHAAVIQVSARFLIFGLERRGHRDREKGGQGGFGRWILAPAENEPAFRRRPEERTKFHVGWQMTGFGGRDLERASRADLFTHNRERWKYAGR